MGKSHRRVKLRAEHVDGVAPELVGGKTKTTEPKKKGKPGAPDGTDDEHPQYVERIEGRSPTSGDRRCTVNLGNGFRLKWEKEKSYDYVDAHSSDQGRIRRLTSFTEYKKKLGG